MRGVECIYRGRMLIDGPPKDSRIAIDLATPFLDSLLCPVARCGCCISEAELILDGAVSSQSASICYVLFCGCSILP